MVIKLKGTAEPVMSLGGDGAGPAESALQSAGNSGASGPGRVRAPGRLVGRRGKRHWMRESGKAAFAGTTGREGGSGPGGRASAHPPPATPSPAQR